ncbi:MAG: HAD-IA family hydrolase [Mogibacterium sp.]|nr:HAD-IA family hydrolase [Mogibacterium sp.]
MIRNVVFDIGKVLIGFDWMDYLRSMFDDETADRITAALWGTDYWKELDLAVLSEEEILDLFYSAGPGYEKEIRQTFDRIGECVTRRDWVIPLLDSLREQGYRVYYLSNLSEHVLFSNDDAFEFLKHMDGGIFSCYVNTIKPGLDIYQCLLDKYGLAPEECLFIDDHPENVAACRKLGMKGIIFTDYDQFVIDLDKALTKDRTHDKITVLCYGDSNTYGYDTMTGGRYPYEKRWTTILADLLGDRYEVIPEGLNGRTTAYDRPGAGWKNGVSSFVACLGTHKPVDYLVIMLGTNDCNAGLDLSAQAIAKGMENLVCLAEEKSPELQGYIPEIIVTAPAAIQGNIEESPFAYALSQESVSKSFELGELYREIADRHLCKSLDATTSAEVSSYDCEHLTEQGHRQLAELMCAKIRECSFVIPAPQSVKGTRK